MSNISESESEEREVKITMTITVTPKLKKELEEDAAKDDRSVSNFVSRVLERRHEIMKTPTRRSAAKGS